MDPDAAKDHFASLTLFGGPAKAALAQSAVAVL
jgi:hypothetical protein